MDKGFISRYFEGELFVELTSIMRFLDEQKESSLEDHSAIIFRDFVKYTMEGVALQASLLEQGLPSTSSFLEQED